MDISLAACSIDRGKIRKTRSTCCNIYKKFLLLSVVGGVVKRFLLAVA
jgi:hypothetical protein